MAFSNSSNISSAVKHNVREQVDSPRKMVPQYGAVVHRVFLVREGIEVSSHALEAVEYLHGRAPGGALERHVLAEMCQPLFARVLVTCPGAYPVAAIYHG